MGPNGWSASNVRYLPIHKSMSISPIVQPVYLDNEDTAGNPLQTTFGQRLQQHRLVTFLATCDFHSSYKSQLFYEIGAEHHKRSFVTIKLFRRLDAKL